MPKILLALASFIGAITFCATAIAWLAASGEARAAAPAEGLDVLYGLRLGVPLAEQIEVCPPAGEGTTPATPQRPCAERPSSLQDGLVLGVRLPPTLYGETGLLRVRGIRVAEGRVVEIELEGMAADLWRLQRSVFQRKGKPAETETYERDGRLLGPLQVKFHTWRDADFTLSFDERSVSEQPRLRAVLNR